MIRLTLVVLRPGAQSTAEMAERLGVKPEELRQRLAILKDQGFVHKIEEGCAPSACSGCMGCESSLTERGKKALDKV
jgi:Mn-dependent DtxR family transcriptional regulator